MITTLLAILLFLIFLFIGILHIYWGLGGKWAFEGTLPVRENHTKPKMPGLLPCCIVALGLLCFGMNILLYVHLLPMFISSSIVTIVMWNIVIIFMIRSIGDFRYVGFFKIIKNSTFSFKDTWYYSPLCLCISLLALYIIFQK